MQHICRCCCLLHLLTRVTVKFSIFLYKVKDVQRNAFQPEKLHKMKLSVSDVCLSSEKLQSIVMVQSLFTLPPPLNPTFRPVKDTYGVAPSAAELDVVCRDPRAELLPHLLQIRNTSSICIQRLGRSNRLQKSLDWAIRVAIEYTLSDIIWSEIAIQESLWSFFCPQHHLWVLVLEGLKLGLPPHLLPPIRWIKPPPPINFFSPQLLLASITHKTLQVKYSDY